MSSPDGLGMIHNNRPSYVSEEEAASLADDVSGNGIFSDRPNMHLHAGVFEDNYALPGYVAREDGAGKSEVIDQQTGTPIEVYLTGTWTGQQFMPSTQPRWPYPDPAPEYPNYGVLADRYDLTHADPSVSIVNADMPASPVPVTMPIQGATPATQQMRVRMPPTGRAVPLKGLGEFTGITSAPAWQWALAGIVLGVAAAYAWEEFGGGHVLLPSGPWPLDSGATRADVWQARDEHGRFSSHYGSGLEGPRSEASHDL